MSSAQMSEDDSSEHGPSVAPSSPSASPKPQLSLSQYNKLMALMLHRTIPLRKEILSNAVRLEMAEVENQTSKLYKVSTRQFSTA